MSISSSQYRDLIFEDDSDIESPVLLNTECEDLSGNEVEGFSSPSELTGDHDPNADSIDIVIENLEALKLSILY